MNSFTRIVGACLAGAFLLAGCGGGGADSSPTAGINGGGAPVNNNGGGGGGTTTAAFAKGAITAVATGSLTVNGTAIATTGAAVSIDGTTGAATDLKVGQVVAMQGTVSTAGAVTATSLSVNNELEGPVTANSINLANLTFEVLGLTVYINGSTVFDNSSLPNGFASLASNDIVEVSGFWNTVGNLVATRIEKRTGAASPFEVNGAITNLNTAASTFSLGSLVVSYGSAVITNGSVAPNACVEVKGTQFAGSQLVATSVEIKSCALGGTSTSKGEVEGLITTFVSASDFSIGAQRVLTTASTNLVTNGANVLALNVKVEAEGSFDASGNLVATKVEIKADNSLRVLGTISSTTAPGTIVVNGVTVLLSTTTRQEDKSSANDPALTFADLAIGNYVEARGFNSGTNPNAIAAIILERDNPPSSPRAEIQGLATTTTGNTTTLTILGVAVDTTGATFKDVSGGSITRATFFAQANGKLVKARSRSAQVVPNVFTAEDEVQIESP
jgi:hypothetical protein